MTVFSISADSHITEPGDCYIDRIDPRFRDRAPIATTDANLGAVMIVDNGKSRIPYGMVAAAGRPWDRIGPNEYVPWEELHPGGWDPKARLVEQDRDGVAGEVLYPSVGMLLCNHPDVDYKKACFDAYNLWIAEFQSHAPERIVGLGDGRPGYVVGPAGPQAPPGRPPDRGPGARHDHSLLHLVDPLSCAAPCRSSGRPGSVPWSWAPGAGPGRRRAPGRGCAAR